MALDTRPRTLEIYRKEDGTEPYTEWIRSFRDKRMQRRILARVGRMRLGNFGDHKAVGDGVWELRLFFGPGYRVYFTEAGETIVLLLCGGDKSRQKKDIEQAKEYWHDYKKRTR